MHPRRRPDGIEADAARLHPHGDVADRARANVLKMRVYRLALHVLRMFGDLARAPAQHGVGLRRAIARQYVDGLGRPRPAIDLPQNVEQARVHLGGLVEPPVAHEPIELFKFGGIVAAVAAEGEAAALVGVVVDEAQRAGFPVRPRRLGALGRAREGVEGDARQKREPAPPPRPCPPVAECRQTRPRCQRGAPGAAPSIGPRAPRFNLGAKAGAPKSLCPSGRKGRCGSRPRRARRRLR